MPSWNDGNANLPDRELALRVAAQEDAKQDASDNGGSIAAVGDVTLASDTDVSGAGDIVLSTSGVERARIKADGTTSGLFVDPSLIASVEELTHGGYLPSPGTVYAQYPLHVATFPQRVAAFWLTPSAAVAASDTVYWNARLLRRPGKFGAPPVYIPTGSPATVDGYYKTMILAETGLLDYYMLDETSGTTATDAGSGAHNGTYETAAVAGTRGVPGVQNASNVEAAYAFDGSHAISTASYALPWAAGGSYECWFFLASGSWATTRFALIGNGAGAGVPSLEMVGGTATDGTINNGIGVFIPGTSVAMTDETFPGLEPGEWHHVVYTRASGGAGDNTHKLYIDGVSVSLTGNGLAPTTAFLSTSTPHWIGANATVTRNLPAGSRMAHVAFYNSVLSQAQVTRHFNYGYELFHKTSRLRDGEALAAYQGWGSEAFPFGTQAYLSAGDTVVLEMEPFGSPVTPGALGFGLRMEPV